MHFADPLSVLRACIREAGGDLNVAIEAANYILSLGEPVPRAAVARPRPWIDEFGLPRGAGDAELSNEGREHREEQDRRGRKKQLRTLAVLDQAVADGQSTVDAAMALMEDTHERTTDRPGSQRQRCAVVQVAADRQQSDW